MWQRRTTTYTAIIPQVTKNLPKIPDCKNSWYGGIGIDSAITIFGTTIQHVYSGYPGDANGLLPGDVIISPEENQIRGEPGTEIRMKLMRGGSFLEKTFLRERVCY